MKVLSVTSEIHPLIKTGGLADVAGALPGALATCGVVTTTFVPGYPQVIAAIAKSKPVQVANFDKLLGVSARVLAVRHSGLDLLILESPALFQRDGGPYVDANGLEYADSWLRFAAFSKAAAHIVQGAISGYQPDIIHVHDWQAAMAPAYLRYSGKPSPGSMITIHNLAFQGRYPAAVFKDLELPAEAYSVDGVEYYGGVGYLKAGLLAADVITTVSPTYAHEIKTPEFGMGLDGLLNAKSAVLHGIVNGIDVGEWSPENDAHIAANYSAGNLQGRQENRRALESELGVRHDPALLLAIVSRLTWQKGTDLIVDSIEEILESGVRLAILGSGDKALEAAVLGIATRFPQQVAVRTGYDEALAHLMQAGADAILIPSRFEPCGLTQLYGLHYGCVPIVARTGGLADTVVDANHAALELGVATGVQFQPDNQSALIDGVKRAVKLHATPGIWKSMQLNGMRSDVSWKASALRYAGLYRQIAGLR